MIYVLCIYLVDKLIFYKREISEALLGCLERITRRELGGWETIVLRDEMLSSLFGAKKAA